MSPMLFALSTTSFMTYSTREASMIIQDRGARGPVGADWKTHVCTVADGHSEGDIKTCVTGLPVNPPKFFR